MITLPQGFILPFDDLLVMEEGGLVPPPDLEVDCRPDAVQEIGIDLVPGAHYVVWLIPVQYDATGAAIKFDGDEGRPDHMAFVDLGGAVLGGGPPVGVIADPVGGAVQDAEVRVTIIALLAALRALGVAPPAGGVVVDAEARTAIIDLLSALAAL